MMKKSVILFLFNYFYAVTAFSAQTDCPVQLALTDTAGSPITSSVDYEVHFYGASSGGAELITADTGTDTPTGGILRIPVTCSSTLLSNANIFLEFVINGETLSPRVEMASSPFAGTAFAVAGNSITLGTDTVGSYVQSLTAGSGISITGGSGESAALTISATGITLSAGDVTSTTILDGTIATADLADGSVTSAKISDGTIVSADINAAAAIPYTKLTLAASIVAADVSPDAFDFTNFADNMTLDSSTNISLSGTNELTISNSGTGNSFIVNDASTGDATPFTIDNDGNVFISQAAEATTTLGVGGTVRVTNASAQDSFVVNDQAADASPFVIDNAGNVGIKNSTPSVELDVAGTISSTQLIVQPPATENITNGATVTANACGTIKRITTAGINIDTDTTNTFTAPSASLAGCCMDIVNVGTFNLTFKHNANFMTSGGIDQTLGPDDIMRVCCTGASGKWYQVSISDNS